MSNVDRDTFLKPCPFCGETELLKVELIEHDAERRPLGFRWTGHVVCLNCFAKCGTHGFNFDADSARKTTISAWNRRAYELDKL